MNVFVTGTKTPASLFAVRRLVEMGYDVTVGGFTGWDYWMYVQGVKRRVILPSLRYEPLRFADAVLAELRSGAYDVYVSTFEEGYLMSYFGDEIRKHVRYVSMPFDKIMTMYDKGSMRDVAVSAGVPVPNPTIVPRSSAELENLFKEIDFPVVVKQRQACDAHGQRIVRDPAELPRAYRELVTEYETPDFELPLIQRFVSGPLICTGGLAHKGELIGHIAFRALRTFPRKGGTSALKELVDSPKATAYDAAMIKKLNWTGFFSSDYLTDPETGELYLIDVNPRMVPGLILGCNAGTDLMKPFMDIILGNPVAKAPKPKAGTRGRMQFLDLGWLLDSFIDPKMTLKEKYGALRQWFDRGGPMRDDVLSWSDPKPGIVLYTYIFTRLRRLLMVGGEMFLEHGLFDGRTVANALKTDSLLQAAPSRSRDEEAG